MMVRCGLSLSRCVTFTFIMDIWAFVWSGPGGCGWMETGRSLVRDRTNARGSYGFDLRRQSQGLCIILREQHSSPNDTTTLLRIQRSPISFDTLWFSTTTRRVIIFLTIRPSTPSTIPNHLRPIATTPSYPNKVSKLRIVR